MAEPMRTEPTEERAQLPDHVVQPLLSRIAATAIDEDYEHVAARKEWAGGDEPPPVARWIAPVVLGIFGLLVVIAAVQTSRDAATAEESREALVRQIGTVRDGLADKQEQLADIREQNATLQEELGDLTADEQAASRRLIDLEAWTGYRPVSGEGVRVRLDNSPDGSGDGVVRDEDLATLVYGLWEAGAEAIAINGQRLTAITGIRTVNRAIHVKTRPLSQPYIVEAIGNRNTLQADFAESSSGSTFLGLRNTFGFVFEMTNEGSLQLPGRNQPYLREAVLYPQTPDNEGGTP